MKIYIGNYPNHRWYHRYLYEWFGYTLSQKKYIHIDKWDTWSMDYTLAEIAYPMLVQLRKDSHGAPFVDPVDVPEHLQPTHKPKDDVDNTHFERWNWVLDEMIYAFDCKVNKDDVMLRFKDDLDAARKEQDRISNGFRLFGKYYENLWD